MLICAHGKPAMHLLCSVSLSLTHTHSVVPSSSIGMDSEMPCQCMQENIIRTDMRMDTLPVSGKLAVLDVSQEICTRPKGLFQVEKILQKGVGR
jgi:hypothetical protein